MTHLMNDLDFVVRFIVFRCKIGFVFAIVGIVLGVFYVLIEIKPYVRLLIKRIIEKKSASKRWC